MPFTPQDNHTPGPAVVHSVPATVVQAEHERLSAAVRGLPGPFLAALISGLERHGEDLVPLRLFASRERGGCAVGAMLRELRPETFATPSRLSFWLRHRGRSRASSYGGELASCKALGALEDVFDRSVRRICWCRRGAGERQAAVAVGRWMLEVAEAELALRHDAPLLRLGLARADPSREGLARADPSREDLARADPSREDLARADPYGEEAGGERTRRSDRDRVLAHRPGSL